MIHCISLSSNNWNTYRSVGYNWRVQLHVYRMIMCYYYHPLLLTCKCRVGSWLKFRIEFYPFYKRYNTTYFASLCSLILCFKTLDFVEVLESLMTFQVQFAVEWFFLQHIRNRYYEIFILLPSSFSTMYICCASITLFFLNELSSMSNSKSYQ